MTEPSRRVAIVGLGGVFPGAPDPSRFWELLSGGIDATTDVPPGRWRLDPARAYDPSVAAPDRVYSTRGGFVDPVGLAPEDLGLVPDADADRLDPMFHLALHAGRAAWEDARTDAVDRSRVGVILGNIVLPTETTSALAWETLGRTLAERALGPEWAAEEFERAPTAPLNRFAAGLPAGLIARALGLGGTAYTLDAACASSLYALKLAADELLSGRADAMLTGGISRPDPLYTQMGFAQLRALSASGRPRPFEARGDGLVVGEGAGVFVLKRLDDALRQGDRIYGLVAAVGLSNDVDGGLLAPSSEGQLRAMRSAYESAGWDPRDVDLIECHATGTPVGDAVEFESLKSLWGPTGWAPGACRIGSHKSNIGHLLTAAGSAGLMKVLLGMKHRTAPPTANFAAPAAKIGLSGSPFRVLDRAEDWPAPESGRPRRAAVSGFGFGGINAHALIEEWQPSAGDSFRPPARRPAFNPENAAVAVVGVGAHFGPFRGLADVRPRLLGGANALNEGFHVDELTLPLDRFRIPPKELEEMLPQQSLALLAAADAVEDAGWKRDRPRLRAGVLLGIGLDPNTTNFHVRWAVEERAPGWCEATGLSPDGPEGSAWTKALKDAAGPALSANRTMGALGGLIASRVAREFRLGGPSFTISSEETSGLHALEVAARLLSLGEIDEAVVGAVDLTGDPRLTDAARRSGCDTKPRGDGAVAFVLKRLDDARRDGDRVHAVIRAVGSASGAPIDAASPDERTASLARGRGPADSPGLTIPTGSERMPASPVETRVGHTGLGGRAGGGCSRRCSA
ncbi:MAG: beta-ketoacyl synthase N-terminal-like domain-containing protein [Isosphaeraceae bacterium]